MMLRTAPPLSLIFFVCYTSLDVWIVLGRLTRSQKFQDWISQTIIFYAYQTSNLPKSKSFKSLQPKLKFKHPEFSKKTEQTLNIDLAQHYMCDVSRLLTYYYIPLRAQYFNSIGLHITSLALFTQSIVLFGKNMYMLTIYSMIWHFQDSYIF